jgi:hypothetical protein
MEVNMKKGKSKRPLDSASVCGHEDPSTVRELLAKVGINGAFS